MYCVAFRCCYCSTFNPARKDKPVAPRLVSADDVTQAAAASDEDAHTAPAAEADTTSTLSFQSHQADLPDNKCSAVAGKAVCSRVIIHT